jgi:plastocyanin
LKSKFITLSICALCIAAALPVTPAAAAVTFDVKVGRFFAESDHTAESMRFYPGDLKVAPGDILHFTTESFHGVTLLTAGTDPSAWTRDHVASGGAYGTFVADPDEGSRAAKVNLDVAMPSDPCGWPGQEVCEFDGSGDEVLDALNSGLPLFPSSASDAETKELSFSVMITADPGSVLYAIDPLHPAMRMKIEVVGSLAERSDPATTNAASEAQFAADRTRANQLHNSYSKKRVKKVVNGKTVWQAWAGVEERGISLRRMYPARLTIKPGHQVKWIFTKNLYEAHTVTFPRARATSLANSFPDVVCDPNGDQDPVADTQPSSSTFPFCSSYSHLELDVPQGLIAKAGNGVVKSTSDQESSGARGAAYAPTATPYLLTFPKRSPKEGFTYACAIHEAAHARMRGSIVVKP